MRSWLTLSAAVSVSLFALHAEANSGGLKGKSGKDGTSCSQANCHSGGTAPTVKIDGPETLAAGASGDYTFTVTTTLAKASAGIASDTGKLTAGTGLKLDGTELTHSASVSVPAAGEGKFTFKVKAPTSGTKFKIWAAGLASDGVGGALGDMDATTTLEVAVTGGGAKASTTTGDDDDDTTSTTSKKKKTSGDDGDDASTGIPNSGCASTPERGDALSALGVLATLAVFLKVTRGRKAS